MRHLKLFAINALAAAVSSAQAPAQDKPDSSRAAPPSRAGAPPLDFSGILFANYQYRGEKGSSKGANRFDVERAYFTFRLIAGPRTSVRITSDLFQQTSSGSDSFYRGWVLRAKYAYLQHEYLSTPKFRGVARFGMLQTVFIEHDEQFWPRWIGNSPTERAGFFSSADVGASTQMLLPFRAGEVYATITNGPGYTSRETDRFKDYAARITLTPFAGASAHPLRTMAATLWAYQGAIGSRFAGGGTGQIGPIGSALDRDRWGIHLGLGHPRATAALQYARRNDEGEGGANTAGSPRVVIDSSGSVYSGYATLRPLRNRASQPHPLGVLVRWDRVLTNRETRDLYNLFIGGLIWDLSSRASVALDYQEATPARGQPIIPTKTYFLHLVARY